MKKMKNNTPKKMEGKTTSGCLNCLLRTMRSDTPERSPKPKQTNEQNRSH
jgi:hypothetical protein